MFNDIMNIIGHLMLMTDIMNFGVKSPAESPLSAVLRYNWVQHQKSKYKVEAWGWVGSPHLKTAWNRVGRPLGLNQKCKQVNSM